MRTRWLAAVAGGIALAGMAQSAGAQTNALPPGFVEEIVVSRLARPTAMAFAPDGRIFICEQQTGKVRVFHNGQLTDFVTLNVSSNSERGVLGIAFDPRFALNGYVYIYYTTNENSLDPPATPKNRVSRFTAVGDVAAAGSETILLDNIPSDAGNHNGGCLRIGPDDKLYVATGDGGSNHQNSQNLGNLAGKILRLNLDGSVPDDNPFANQTGKRGEIYCYGLRNPFRFCFRPGTNTLYIGDVGETTWEEVDVGQPGGNYGWPNSEGPDNVSGYLAPLYYYNHNGQAAAITGGCFLEGKNYPPYYRGSYFFGDYVQGFLRRLVVTAENQLVQALDFGPADSPVDFAQGPDGDLYYVSILSGTVRRIRYIGRGIRGSRQSLGGIGTPRPH
ncbi:MAG TPA: PQQ-dependent sugar dehydrogenase [Chthonomonadaceae bacterium]|nr:PQQ-dependent sugar dehydrogenase [Chthonomonadaceae bacterium]